MSTLKTNAIRNVGSSVDGITIDSNGYVLHNQRPHFIGYMGSGSPTTYNNGTYFSTDGEWRDNQNCWNGSRFTCPVEGLYMITFNGLTTNNSASADLRLHINGANQFVGAYSGNATGYTPIDLNVCWYCESGDYIQIQSWGSTLHEDTSYHCWINITYLG
jgi:hypothetical protein